MRQADNPLELTGQELSDLVDAAMERVIPHIDSLEQQPAAEVEGGAELARSLVEPLPEEGAALADVLDLVFERAVPKSFNTAGPGYLAYIPGGGIPHSAVADLIADCVNRYVGVWLAAPGLAQLEANVVRWLCQIMGYGSDSLGFLTSGGSLANFSALVTARRKHLPDDFLNGTLYASDQAHHSIQKAAMLAGFPSPNLRVIKSDELFRIDCADLVRAIEEDRSAGRSPFLIVASAGTTNTGAVDDFTTLADLAAKYGMWLHVDGAYGGFFMLTQRGREAMPGIERADSIVLDPHKGLFLPYGTGSLLVRDGAALRRAHTVFADYMPAMQEEEDLVDFCQISPELSRPFRGLAIWLPIKLLGIEPFRRNLDEKLDLTLWATEQLRLVDGIEIVAEPRLSIVAFRLSDPDLDAESLNRLNQDFLTRVNRRKRVYLTATSLSGLFTLRICVLSFRTHLDRMEEALADLRDAAMEARRALEA
ncbi:MAG: aminotransferase class I/II-fold pyridoxal phosphate-dependent enzyme [Gemmatimonadales bacterium]